MEGLEIHSVSFAPLRPVGDSEPNRAVAHNDDANSTPARTTREAAADKPASTTDKLKAVLADVLDNLPENARLSIHIDRDANRYVYEFIDPKSGEVKGQFPSEDVLKALRANRQAVSGQVLDQSA